MEEKSRLIVSVVLALLLHVSFLLKADNSIATMASSQNNSVQFNLITLIQTKPAQAKQAKVFDSVKSTPKSTSEVNKIKQVPVKKRLKEADPIIAKNVIKRVVEKKAPLIQRLVNEAIISSVTRKDNKNILQQPQFKSLPPPPVYPRQARVRGQQGTAIIHARLNEQGEVIKTRLAKSSGFTLLDSAALKAVQNWDFLPGEDDNGAAQVWVEIPVQFILNSQGVS